jgi:hypothetical protein
MPFLTYAAGNSSVAAINKNLNEPLEYVESIAQTGSFGNHTHNTTGLTYSRITPSAEYCNNTFKLPIGAILIAPSALNAENSLYVTSSMLLNDINGT